MRAQDKRVDRQGEMIAMQQAEIKLLAEALNGHQQVIEASHLKMTAAVSLIQAILESDRKALRKQRHTAQRIYDRIRGMHTEVSQTHDYDSYR
jgi:hypothetical protein